jgi:hypothetical protein
LELAAGNWLEAANALGQSLALRLRLGEEFDFPDVLVPLGTTALESGNPLLAAYFCGAAEAARDKTGRTLATEVSSILLQVQKRCRDEIGEDAFCREAARGSASRSKDWLRAVEEIAGLLNTLATPPQFIYA